MGKVIIVKRKQLWLIGLCLMLIAGCAAYYGLAYRTKPVGGLPEGERVIHLVTGEFSSEGPDGEKLEAYVWHPATILMEKGERVKLVLYGVNGESHPFYIEGTTIRGEVRKGKETIVDFHPQEEGVYRLICLTHPDKEQKGPMIAYIHVD